MDLNLNDVFAEQDEQTREDSVETEDAGLWADDPTPPCPPSETLEKGNYSQAALTAVLTQYGAGPEILQRWNAMWADLDLPGWIFRVSTSVCYTPQVAEQVRSIVFAGTPDKQFRDGFLYRVASGGFELRTQGQTLNYLRQAFKSRSVDLHRQETYQRTSRGPYPAHLRDQINRHFGTRLRTSADMKKFLGNVKGLGFTLPVIGGGELSLDDIRLDHAGPVKVITREHPEHLPAETDDADEEPTLSPEDTSGSRTVGEQKIAVWNGNDRVANAAIRGVFYTWLGRTAAANSPAATSGAKFYRWLGETILSEGYDGVVAALLQCNLRRVQDLRDQGRREWRQHWK